MKVGFIAPLSIAAVNGGVRTQTQQTAEHLQKLGVEIEFISPWSADLDIDLAHIFLAGPDVLGITKRLRELSIPIVLSPVFFANRSAKTISRVLKIEKALSAIGSGIRSEFGVKSEICSNSDLILPNTLQEGLLIEEGLGISADKIIVVPNGVESRFKDANPELFTETHKKQDFVLFAGQAGAPRKNVITLIKAAADIDAEIIIIGPMYEDDYSNECRSLARNAGNVTFLGELPHNSEMLASAYAACHTFVLPSYFETPGIAAMEAALAGACIAITERGGTQDYFRDMVSYLNPQSVSSIAHAVNESLKRPKSGDLKEHILSEYRWKSVAEKTLEVYRKLIS